MNLLIDPVISVMLKGGGSCRVCLPKLFELAARDEIIDFPVLRPHQFPAWHLALVQLAVLAVLAQGGDPPAEEEGWRIALRALTPEHAEDEPWTLVVDDWSKPGFLQAPLDDERDRSHYKRTIDTADGLDVLITSKNHDVKGARMAQPTAEEWLYALLTLQTTEGFLGAGNYGIVRMNGGFASRPMLRIAPTGLGPGGQWLRDVTALLQMQNQWQVHARELGVGTRAPHHELLWLLPWNGERSLSLAHLHPLAVEICRRVRLAKTTEGRLIAMVAGSKVARLDGKSAQGVVGDPWIPIDLRDANTGAKAFTATSEGFSYRRMVSLLDQDEYRPALLQKPTAAEGRTGASMTLTAAALVRGQGKTEGFHQRHIVWGPKTLPLIANAEARFLNRAKTFVKAAADATGKVLRPAVIQLVDGSSEPDWRKPGNDTLAKPWVQRLDGRIDAIFFNVLDTSFQENDDESAASARWHRCLAREARKVFEQAVIALPRKSEGRHLGHARARNLLESALRKQFPSLGDRPSQKENPDVPN